MPNPLNFSSGMPQMSAAFSGWKSKLTFEKITQNVLDTGFIQNVKSSITVNGVWQPQSPEEIQLKPEGQRSWEWFMLHIEGINNNFKTNDRVSFKGNLYKVMAKRDYTLNNYTQLELIADYENTV